jgi:hypothetical protein
MACLAIAKYRTINTRILHHQQTTGRKPAWSGPRCREPMLDSDTATTA